MLEAYLNKREPLTVIVGGQSLKFRNLNDLTAYELNSLIESLKTSALYGTPLKTVLIEDSEDILSTLSSHNKKEIYEEWQRHAGVTIAEIAQVFHMINKYSGQLQADLSSFTNIKTISELLELPAIDLVKVTTSLLTYETLKSHTIAEEMKLIRPASPENSSELLLLTVVNLLRNFLGKESVGLDKFHIQKTDNQNDELIELDPVLKAKQEARRNQWLETGNLQD